jgi:hypothetical protein
VAILPFNRASANEIATIAGFVRSLVTGEMLIVHKTVKDFLPSFASKCAAEMRTGASSVKRTVGTLFFHSPIHRCSPDLSMGSPAESVTIVAKIGTARTSRATKHRK